MRLLRFGVSFLAIGVSSLVSGGCDRCSFQNLDRQKARGTLECCGAFAVHEVLVKPGTNRQQRLQTFDGRQALSNAECRMLNAE
jgi:hypothetical protein